MGTNCTPWDFTVVNTRHTYILVILSLRLEQITRGIPTAVACRPPQPLDPRAHGISIVLGAVRSGGRMLVKQASWFMCTLPMEYTRPGDTAASCE
jgi:hypothetical protein